LRRTRGSRRQAVVQVLPDRAAAAGDPGVVASVLGLDLLQLRRRRPRTTLPTAFAAVRNAAGQVLVVRRIDGGNWDLPGGQIEVGETAGQAVIREVAKESGVRIALAGLSDDR